MNATSTGRTCAHAVPNILLDSGALSYLSKHFVWRYISNAHLLTTPALAGYMLLRGMIEDDLRRKQEQEQQVVSARDAARKLAAMMPLLALLQLSETSESPAKQV